MDLRACALIALVGCTSWQSEITTVRSPQGPAGPRQTVVLHRDGRCAETEPALARLLPSTDRITRCTDREVTNLGTGVFLTAIVIGIVVLIKALSRCGRNETCD